MKSAGGLLLASLLAACTPRRLVLPDTGAPSDTGSPDAACPRLHVSATEVTWENASADGTDPQVVTISNLCAGSAPLVITASLRASGPEVFSFSLSQTSLAPGESAELVVSFEPLDFDAHAGILTIASNAQDPSSEAVILAANTVRDADGDGAESRSAGGGDCDDRDPEVSPGAPELWQDGVDNDCDGMIDQIDVDDALGVVHGEPGDYLGYRSSLSVGDLCGDGRLDLVAGGIYAGPTMSSQGSAWLLDAVSLAGLDGTPTAVAAAQIVGDYYQNYLGPLPQRQGDVDGDGASDLFIAASDRYYHSYGNVSAGIFLDPGELSGMRQLSEADITFEGSESFFSVSAGARMDLDGDGLDEVSYGDWYSSGASGGLVSVFCGASLARGVSLRLVDDADLALAGDAWGDSLGCAFGAGDLDSDGYDDLLVSAPWADRGTADGGEVSLVAGAATLPANGTPSQVARLQVYGTAAEGALGYLSDPQIADLDGDGAPDLVLSSALAETVWVFFAAAILSGPQPVDEADLFIEGDDIDAFGASMATGALLDSGGIDLAVGAPDCINLGTAPSDCDGPGAVYVFAGPTLAGGHLFAGQADFSAHGSAEGGMFGAVIAVGDLTGDERGDLVVSSPGAGSSGEGYIRVFSDPG